jgi:hypothetical protein
MAEQRTILTDTDPKVAAYLKAHDQLVAKRLPFEPMMIEITQFIQPRLNNFKTDTGQGKKRTEYILDSSTLLALRRSSEGYQAYMFPRSMPWFDLELYPLELMKRQDAAIWMKKIRDGALDELSRSDFYQEGGQVIDNGLGIGTSACYVEDSPEERCSQYLAMHPKEVYIARNRFGVVDTLHRRYLMTGRNILETFGDELGKALRKNEIDDLENNAHKDYPLVHITKPRKDRDLKGLLPTDMPWASIYILENQQKLIRESGYQDFPFAVWCCLLNTDEDYGRSPSWDALPDVKRLQKLVRNILRATELPPVFYPQELESDLDLRPEGRIPYRDFQRKIEPIQTVLNIQHAMLVAEQIRNIINEHYDVPFFLMFSARERLQQSPLPTLEVAEMSGERAALMGTKVGRIESDFLDKTIDLTIRNAARAGRLPPPPAFLRQIKDVYLRINYIGPLANLQKRYHGQQNMTMTLAQAAPFIQAWPEAADVVNATESVRIILSKGGFPPEGINDEKTIRQKREKRAKEEQAIKVLAAIQAMGKAVPGLNQPVAPGSPMEELNKTAGPAAAPAREAVPAG